jgi:transposase
VGMSGDRSSRRYDVVAETRRQRSRQEKQAIVAEASAPCANVSAVARRHGISPSLLFRWIKDLKPVSPEPAATFLPVALTAPVSPELTAATKPVKARKAVRIGGDAIEIDLANGRRVRVVGSVDGSALKRIIALLEE